jgi:hypothetical protein
VDSEPLRSALPFVCPPDLRAHHRIACAISDAIGINQDGACACRALVALFRTASVPQAEIWLNPMSSMTRGHFLSFPSPAPSHVPHFEFTGTASGDRLRLDLSVGCLVECMTSVVTNAGDDDEFETSSGIGRSFWHYAIMRLDCPVSLRSTLGAKRKRTTVIIPGY